MKTKGSRTKEVIQRESLRLFSKKGYQAVTMKDICEACSLSRGGLYRHYNSAKEIFLEILEQDKENSEELLISSINSKRSPSELLGYFLEEQTDLLGGRKPSLSLAVYEFVQQHNDLRPFFENRFREAVRILTRLIQYGQERGDFKSGHAERKAIHIIMLLEGLKVSNPVISLSPEELNAALADIREMLIKYEEKK